MPLPTMTSLPSPNTAQRAIAILSLLLLASCGGGSGDAPTATATTTTRERPQAATTSLAVPIVAEADPMLTGLTIPADAPTRGMWSATQSWPMNGLHAVLLGNGKVLTYGTPANTPATQDGRTYDVWSPSLGFGAGSHATTYDANRVNSFCSTAAFLGDGRLLITGGNTPRGSSLFSSATNNATTEASQLADDR